MFVPASDQCNVINIDIDTGTTTTTRKWQIKVVLICSIHIHIHNTTLVKMKYVKYVMCRLLSTSAGT